MLAFFRKYQRYIYTVITVVIVISFSFFGTYGAITEDTYRDDVVFTAVDGSPVTRSELERMAMFIGTDAEDMDQLGGVWGPNFFNDGVLEKDFLKSGLAQILAMEYMPLLKSDIDSRFTREKRFQPYKHPGNAAISAEEIWKRYNPKMSEQLELVRQSKDPMSEEAFNARVNLYLSERAFSAADLKQAIMYIEQMNQQWIQPDQSLPYTDLSLFGYHTAEDWFGPRFMRLVSEFIINSAKIAESKGYDVPKDEVLADLIRNARVSFARNKQFARLGVNNPSQYFQEQLRRMHMDQNQAVKTWRQVMLFRRMFQDVGNTVVTDSLTYKEFHKFANDFVSGDAYTLPEDVHLGSFSDLQQFQMYIQTVAPKNDDPLALPKLFHSVDKAPTELVQNRFVVEYAQIEKGQLQTRVGIKEMWDWQTQEANWKTLANQFSELSTVESKTPEQRRQAIDALDDATRGRVDTFSRKQIVDMHPEWIAETLERATKQRKEISVRAKGGTDPLPGVENRQAFLTFLNDEQANQGRVFTPDNKSYYMINVVEKSSGPEILTFAEAKKEGILNQLVDAELEKYYQRVRDASPTEFQLPDGSWKELSAVKEDVAKRYFSKVVTALQEQTGIKTPDAAATQRFLPYAKNVKKAIMQDPSTEMKYVRVEADSDQRIALDKQWELVKKPFVIDRGSKENRALEMQANTWTEVEALPNGAIGFRHVMEKGTRPQESALTRGVESLHQALSQGAQQVYMQTVLETIKSKDAISLNYMSQKE